MEDRVAPRRRPFPQGIPAQPLGAIPMDQGIPLEQGVVQGPEHPFGIPVAEMYPPAEDTPKKCTATTKKGNPCKAYAMADASVCVGHSK